MPEHPCIDRHPPHEDEAPSGASFFSRPRASSHAIFPIVPSREQNTSKMVVCPAMIMMAGRGCPWPTRGAGSVRYRRESEDRALTNDHVRDNVPSSGVMTGRTIALGLPGRSAGHLGGDDPHLWRGHRPGGDRGRPVAGGLPRGVARKFWEEVKAGGSDAIVQQ